MSNEMWKDVKGFEGLYQVSDLGRVRSLDRVLPDGRRFKGRVLVATPGSNGYPMVGLPGNVNGKVHRMVAEAFLSNPENKPFVLHGDGNPANNRVENLRWGTNSDNLYDSVEHGTHRAWHGEKKACLRGHEFTHENTYTPPGTHYRKCRSCMEFRKKGRLTDEDKRHGTIAGYSSGCRCDPCRNAMTQYHRDWYQRRKETK